MNAQDLLVEAETFGNKGGWVVDAQFTQIMGSPYLLAHGYGKPVKDASTNVNFSQPGQYYLWVRTKNWVPGSWTAPGRFQLIVDNITIKIVFGTITGWRWQYGGKVNITKNDVVLKLHDLTGFEGRCDAIYFTKDSSNFPPNEPVNLAIWRRNLLGLPDVPPTEGYFDVVIVGGGVAGTSAAIAAARSGLKVALIQDRPVLGGNSSDEIRVTTLGLTGFRIVNEVYSDVGYYQRQLRVNEETNIYQYLQYRAFSVQKQGKKIVSVDALNILTGKEYRFFGDIFIDCTGDGWIGYWAGNRYMMGRESSSEYNESLAPAISDSMMMGNSMLWNSINSNGIEPFPKVEWAMDVAKDSAATGGAWFWEYGIGLNPLTNGEEIRDHLFRAIYGTFYNAKQIKGNENLKINWVGYVLGKRESRRLVGAYIFTENDMRQAVSFPDYVAIESRFIDLHLPQPSACDFYSVSTYTVVPQYVIPFRSLFSLDLDNLMMAGRCFSATHVGFGSARVQNTCGQMGVATGYAAGLCKKYNTTPKGVYLDHIAELQDSIGFPKSFKYPRYSIFMDNIDENVEINGNWTSSKIPRAYFANDYLIDDNTEKGLKSVVYKPQLIASGDYTILVRYPAQSGQSDHVQIDLKIGAFDTTIFINQTINNGTWVELGNYYLSPDIPVTLSILNNGTDSAVVADAAAFVLKKLKVLDYVPEISSSQNLKFWASYNNRNTQISCYLPTDLNISIDIIDLTGRDVYSVVKGNYPKGVQTFNIPANTGLSKGVYLARLITVNNQSVIKILIQ